MVARLSEYYRRDLALRKAHGALYAFEAPLVPFKTHVRKGSWHRWAAAAALFVTLIGVGWLYADSRATDRELARLMHDAVVAHLLYLSHPNQSLRLAHNLQHSSHTLTAALGRDVDAPDLSTLGFHLVGAQSFFSEVGTVVLFAYLDATGHRVSCYFRRVPRLGDTGYRHGKEAGLLVSYRLDQQLAYAVVGTLPAERLQQIAEAADATSKDDSDDGGTLTLPAAIPR
jgi:anti-sigma factor RsiW